MTSPVNTMIGGFSQDEILDEDWSYFIYDVNILNDLRIKLRDINDFKEAIRLKKQIRIIEKQINRAKEENPNY